MTTPTFQTHTETDSLCRPRSPGFCAWIARIFLIIIVSTIFVPLSGPASADTLLFRDSKIALPVYVPSLAGIEVKIDNQDATAFASLRDGGIELDVPFPKKRAAFVVQVFDQNERKALFTQTYRKAHAKDLFDTVEITSSGQLDTTFISQAMPKPEPIEEFDENDAQSDLFASVSVTAERESVTALMDLEAVNRTNPDSTLRFNGPNADISRFAVATDYTSAEGHRIYLNVGDTDISSSNSLVNGGMNSRGIKAGFQTEDQRLTLELGRLYGADIVGTVHGPIGWSTDSFRTGGNAQINITDNPNFSWSMHASVLDVKRPMEDSFGTGQTADGETNEVWGFGTNLGVLDQRVRLNLSWASSRYDNPTALNPLDIDSDTDLAVFTPGVTKGSAWRHGLTWDAWNGELGNSFGSLGIELNAESATPFYRSIQGASTADRRQWSAAINANVGSLNARLDTTRFRNNLNNLISIHTLEEAVHNANLTLDLASLHFGDSQQDFYDNGTELSTDDTSQASDVNARILIPSFIGFNAQIQDIKTMNGDDIILAPVITGFDFMDQTTTTVGVSADWLGTYSTTTLEINYSFLDIDQRERASADRRDSYFGLSHSIEKEHWSLSGRVGVTDTDDLDPATQSTTALTDWGLSGTYFTPWGIDLGATFDNSRSRLNDLVLGENTLSRSNQYSLSVNVGKWFGKKLKLKQDPSITAIWQKTNTDEDSPFFTARTSSASTTLNIGVSF